MRPLRTIPQFAAEHCVFLAPLHRAEGGVAASLRRLLAGAPPWETIAADKALPWVETRTGLTLSPSQRVAVTRVMGNKVTVITGGPGVGKTTIVRCLVEVLAEQGCQVALAAPTGRAARRLSWRAMIVKSDGTR